MRRFTLLLLVLSLFLLAIQAVQSQDPLDDTAEEIFVPLPVIDEDELHIPLVVSPVPNEDELHIPLVVSPVIDEDELHIPLVITPVADDDDLFVPLVTNTPMRPTRTPDPRIKLPTDGMYYKNSAVTMETSGQCRKTIYDCDGCGGGVKMGDESQLPQVPICGTAEGILPAVLVENQPYLYIPPSTNHYGQSEFSYMQEVDANGKTIGSFRLETRTDVIVVSPSEVHLTVSFIQEDGCTQTYTIIYTLASAGGATCTAQDFPTSTPPPPTATPQATPSSEEEPTIEPPFPTGPIALYITPQDYIDESCQAENSFPPLDTVDLTLPDEYSAMINAGGTLYTLYRDSDDSYGFDSGGAMANSHSLYLRVVKDGSVWELTWRGTDASSNHCWMTMDLTVSQPIPATPTPIPDMTQGENNGSAGQNSASGTYMTDWMTEYMPACDAKFDSLIPDTATLSLQFTEGAVSVDMGEGPVTLIAEEDWYAYYPPESNGIQLGLMLFADTTNDGWFLSWSASAGSDSCVTSAMLTLS